MKQLLSVVVCMALASVLVAQDNAKKIVGVWEEAKGKGVNLEFTKDGKFKIKGKQGDKPFVIDGTYKVEADKFSMTIGGNTDTSKIKKLTDSELHLEDFFSKEKGKLVEFKRVTR
jgi:uncharacterized protein (TIGR03066 family)